MKQKIEWYFVILLLIFNHSFAQISELSKYSEGQFLAFSSVNNKGNLFGYLVTNLLDSKSTKYNSFEFVLLDKNLNVISKYQIDSDKNILKYKVIYQDDGSIRLDPIYINYNKNSYIKSEENIYISWLINPKTNSIKQMQNYLYDGAIHFKNENDSTDDDFDFKNPVEYVLYRLTNENVLVCDLQYTGNQIYNTGISAFSPNNQLLWRYDLPDQNAFEWATCELIFETDDVLFVNVKKNDTSVNLLALEKENGALLKTIDYEKDDFSIDNLWHLFEHDFNAFVETKSQILLSSFITDSNNFLKDYRFLKYDKSSKSFEFYSLNLDTYLTSKYQKKYDSKGKLNGNYLTPAQILFDANGATALVFEKTKSVTTKVLQSDNKNEKTNGLMLFSINNQFHIEDDTAFGQADETFYFASNNEKTSSESLFLTLKKSNKNYDLGIMKYNKKSGLSQELLNLSENKNLIIPYPAKEGYILIGDFANENENASLRLEKIN